MLREGRVLLEDRPHRSSADKAVKLGISAPGLSFPAGVTRGEGTPSIYCQCDEDKSATLTDCGDRSCEASPSAGTECHAPTLYISGRDGAVHRCAEKDDDADTEEAGKTVA
ncbi:uncharacterized protein LOC142584397 [Dermacentor variabilis]|uniref:uncharacterized protein LOC142584397 n=1 Tax=Dermacentor variabilis TaxID=34621 RepID=UPI003F5B67FC